MFFEALESRTLLSISPVSLQVAADRLQVHADLVSFKADMLHDTATLLGDVKALKLDGVKADPTLGPLFATLKTDVKAMRSQLAADRLAQAKAVVKDQAAILKDMRQARMDRGNPTAVTADRAQLLADRIQLQTDEIAGLTARINTRQSAFDTISADLQAIATAASGDSGYSAKLTADINKFVTDRTNSLNTMTADLNKIKADRTQLQTDLAAMQNS